MRYIKKILLALLLLVSCSPLYAGDGIENMGTAGQFVLPATAILSTLYYRDKIGTIQFIQAFASTLLTTYALKFTVNRRRPNGGHYAFPSGHTASAFAGAAFLQQRYGWYYGIPAYAAASFVGWSRVHANMHYPTDVLAGAAIGIAANLLFTTRFNHKIAIIPYVRDQGAGLAINIPFQA